MGCYVDPLYETKEEFLKREGQVVTSDYIFRNYQYIKQEGSLPVILIDNGNFTAAGVAYTECEFELFTVKDDNRPKRFFIVPIEKLMTVSPIEEYLEGSTVKMSEYDRLCYCKLQVQYDKVVEQNRALQAELREKTAECGELKNKLYEISKVLFNEICSSSKGGRCNGSDCDDCSIYTVLNIIEKTTNIRHCEARSAAAIQFLNKCPQGI